MKKVGAGDKKSGDKKKGSSMGDAVKGTEAIRTWDEHKIGPQALAERLGTDVTRGLSDEASKKSMPRSVTML